MEFDQTPTDAFLFGPFELKPSSGELCRDGITVKLPPQPFKVLWFLIRNAGQMVSRKTLQETVWGTETFVDFDKGLNLCIAQIREALGDDPQSPSYIETLPRRGYRFIGDVKKKTAPPKNSSIATPESIAKSIKSRPTALILSSTCIILVATALFFYFRSLPAPAAAKETKSMLLVLPFENLTGDPAQDYFSDGLTEEMITRLGSLRPRRLGVIARTTALTYKKTTKDIRRIGDELGVDYVLEGSVRREAGRLRITSQLIQVNDQTHLWANSFDRDEKDVLDIQREVATRIASSLSLELLPASSTEAAAVMLARPEAYDAYLKGRFLITKDTPEDLERSIPYFQQAIAEDPSFAPAYAAEVEAMVLLTDWTGSSSGIDVSRARSAALRSVELDPLYAEAYAALGSVQFALDRDRSNAEINFQRAVELNPYNPLTRINYGRCLLAKGETDAAIIEFREAIKLDPVSLLTTGLAAFAHLQAGHYDEAIVLSKRMLELEPKSWAARECLFRSHINTGNYAEAVNVARERMTLGGATPEQLKTMENGDPKTLLEARFRKDLDGMKKSFLKGEKVWTMYGAWAAVKLGEKDLAFEWLERAIADHASFLMYLDVDPVWDPLRSDPRFDDLKRRTAS